MSDNITVRLEEERILPAGIYKARLISVVKLPIDKCKYGPAIAFNFEVTQAPFVGSRTSAISNLVLKPGNKLHKWLRQLNVPMEKGREIDLPGLVGIDVTVVVKEKANASADGVVRTYVEDMFDARISTPTATPQQAVPTHVAPTTFVAPATVAPAPTQAAPQPQQGWTPPPGTSVSF